MSKKKKKQPRSGNWHCSLALVEGFSQANLLVTGSWQQWKSIRTAERSSWSDKKRGISIRSQSTQTSTPSRERISMGLSMSLLPDSHALHSLWRVKKRERWMKTISGRRLGELLGKYSQEESSWRTCPDCFGCTDQLFSETFPLWGSIVDGGLYLQEIPELDTFADVGGVWLTPRAGDTGQGENQATFLSRNDDRTDFCAQSLAGQVRDQKTWPTPRAENASSSRPNQKGGKVLAEEAQIAEGLRERGQKWPTPQSRDWKNAHGPRFVDSERSNDLNDAVDFIEKRAWPTPTVGDSKSSGSRNTSTSKANEGMSLTDATRGDGGMGRLGGINSSPLKARVGGKLNPDWVEWLMGWPVGWTSLDPLPAERMSEWEKGVSEGSWWTVDPVETIPRLTSIKESRVNRLKALGNGQVPAQVLLALEVLSNEQ